MIKKTHWRTRSHLPSFGARAHSSGFECEFAHWLLVPILQALLAQPFRSMTMKDGCHQMVCVPWTQQVSAPCKYSLCPNTGPSSVRACHSARYLVAPSDVARQLFARVPLLAGHFLFGFVASFFGAVDLSFGSADLCFGFVYLFLIN